jgi:hypothetical protein
VDASWARSRGPLFACSAGLALVVSLGRSEVPGHDLDRLAEALGRAAGGAIVAPSDIRWEPSGGLLDDLAFGRWAVFLARAPADDARDVWRARVRLSPEGHALAVDAAHDLTATPLGDDHELVVRGTHAAFATRAYGQEQSVTVLDLAGEGAQNKATAGPDRVMAALTSLQQTGRLAGVGRIGITLETPARAVGLELDDASLAMTLFPSDARRAATSSVERLDLATGDLAPPTPSIRAEPWTHLPKRLSHWVVDTLRAVPWIGPAPIAWLEDQALAARDAYRRFAFASSGAETQIAVVQPPPPPTLDTSQASVEEAHWPPVAIPTIWQSAEPGEGEWVAPDLLWLRAVPGVTADAPSPFYRTFVRPDPERPYVKVLLVAMDLRQLDFDMEAGVEDPEPLTGPPGSGRIPRDPAIYRRVAAAFNGAFKTEHGHYGMMVHRRVLLPPIPGSATVVVLDDGRVGFGTWGQDRKVGGIVGVADEQIASFRQNLEPLFDQGRFNPTGRSLWGFTLPGKGAQTERSGMCVTTGGHLVYAWGDDVSATTLAKALEMAACDYALHLDMNPYHTGFLFAAIDDLAGKKYKSQLLTPGMSIPVDRYIQYAPKDFFYVMVHDPTPPALGVDAASPWAPDGGTQPPPHWMPGLWRAHVDGPHGPTEVFDIEPDRATWRIRAGIKEAPASRPLRELTGDGSRAVLLAATLGFAPEKHPLGLATDGRLAVSIHGGADLATLVADDDGHLSIVRSDDAPIGPHADLVELPLLLYDAKPVAAPSGALEPRAALGTTATGRVLVARGTFSTFQPLVEALAQAGCDRAVALDRGTRSTATIDRSGTPHPPLARYDESVLYALGAPLHPRGFRFDAKTPALTPPPRSRAAP